MKHRFLQLALIVSLALVLGGRLAAQNLTILHTFSTATNDGYNLLAGVTLSGNTLFGVTDMGGTSDNGAIFAISTSGAGFSNVYSFTAENIGTNIDGANPDGTMLLSGGTIYGSAANSGFYNAGTLFSISTNGNGFTNFYNFTGGNDGNLPDDTLVLSSNYLFGTTRSGGTSNYGILFRINTDGTGFTNLHSFTNGTDGAVPHSLILSGNTLYGPTLVGTIFKVNTDGNGFTNLHTFTAAGFSVSFLSSKSLAPNFTNNDGVEATGLIVSGNTLYGTTMYGGSNGNGTVFSLGTDGSGFTVLHQFAASSLNPSGLYTNSDGTHPYTRGMVLSGGILYGTAAAGGSNGVGTVFSLAANNGAGFATLHTFAAATGSLPSNLTNTDGALPFGGALILSGNTLYGTAKTGGTNGSGTLFALTVTPPPSVALVQSGTKVILTWPTNTAGFTLRATTNLFPPSTWTNVSPAPATNNTNYVVTNTISGKAMFYQLVK